MPPEFDPSECHKLYKKWRRKWMRQRHLIEGEDRIKMEDVSEDYLPRLDGQSSDAMEHYQGEHVITTYHGYKKRAVYMNAVGRTRDGLVGAIMRKEPEVTIAPVLEELREFMGFGLESLEELVDNTLDEVVGVGRYGLLVDMAAEGESMFSAGDERPYVSSYIAESITDWELGLVDGRKRLVRVNLQEESGLPATDEERDLEMYRVLRLGIPTPVTSDEEEIVAEQGPEAFLALFGLRPSDFEVGGVYYQEIWVEVDGADQVEGRKKFTRTSITVPRAAGGRLLREIPFVFFNSTHTHARPDKPMLLDLAVLNLAHYRNSADYEHGLHFTGLPQPWVAGFKFDGELYIGSGVAWQSEEPNAKAGYLEFTGQGLTALKDAMADKEKGMAAMGARLLEEQQPGGAAEAAETVKLRQSGEGSALSRVADATSYGLSRVMRYLATFMGAESSENEITLNTDFGVEGMTSDMLNALMGQVVSGLMSWDTYVYNVRRGELYPDDFDQDAEASAIQQGPPGQDLGSMMGRQPEEASPPDEDDPVEDDEEDESSDGE